MLGGWKMQATGIVRRVDDLGRIIIPNEIRRAMRIKEGDALEIYTTREGEIVLKASKPLAFDDVVEMFKEFDIPQQKELLQKLVAEIKE